MKLTRPSFKLVFYLTALICLLIYLIMADLIKWIIAGASILYLIFYFSIATFAIFSVSLTEIGPMFNSLSQKSSLLALILIVPTLLLFWLVLLIFWPIFIIPERSLVRNPEKYDAIANFEAKVRAKYSKY